MKISPRIVKIIIFLTLLLVAIFFIARYFIWINNYRDRIYPGIKIGSLDLGGKTLAETEGLIASRVKTIEETGLPLKYNKKTVTLATAVNSFDSDLSYQVLTFNVGETAQTAYGRPEDRTFLKYLLNIFQPKTQKNIKAVYTLNEDAVRSFLTDNFEELNIEPGNAYFSVSEQEENQFKLHSNQETLGKEINYPLLFEELRINLNNLENTSTIIKTRSKYPTVKLSDLTKLETEIEKIIYRGDLVLRRAEIDNEATSTDYWRIKADRLVTWASVQTNGADPKLYFDQEKIKEFLKINVAPKIDLEAALPRFEMKDGRVISWQTGKNGRQLDLEATAARITADFLNGQNEVDLIIKEVTGEWPATDNNLNIKEILGTGHSVFAGSPANRRHNIAVGAAALHGLLIKPGEEFSLIKTLGDISDKTGYLQELVIKGDKTVPEYGGGLCQIGTTVFRTALASGLPITSRQNHSYRVSYYEPAGTDATIYIPQPDLRFVNDTGNYILIQARIVKNDLYFDFWGTSDGRISTTTAPIIYNIVKPEPTKTIESEDLKPGEKKCTESSHNGADAYFDYKVIYPDNVTTTPIQERRFKSHYVPWQAVCLIGKNATSTSTSSATSTSNTSTSTINEIFPDQKATGTPAASD